MPVFETSESAFEEDVRAADLVLVDFWAPWCRPCVALNPLVEALAVRYGAQLRVLKMNLNDADWSKFGIRQIPAFRLYVNGVEHALAVGPSAMRLQMTVDRWLAEVGGDLECDLKTTSTSDVEDEVPLASRESKPGP